MMDIKPCSHVNLSLAPRPSSLVAFESAHNICTRLFTSGTLMQSYRATSCPFAGLTRAWYAERYHGVLVDWFPHLCVSLATFGTKFDESLGVGGYSFNFHSEFRKEKTTNSGSISSAQASS